LDLYLRCAAAPSLEVQVGASKKEEPQQGERRGSEPSTWVEAYGDVLYRYALSRLRDPQVAESIVQEALLAALESRASFAGRSSERTWLVGILKHKIYDHFRRQAREPSFEDVEELQEAEVSFTPQGRWLQEPGRWDPSPEVALEDAQLWAALDRCVEALPPRLAQIFTLREMEGIKGPELCKLLGITTTNLGVMLYRARARLRSCLEQSYFSTQEGAG